MTNKYINLPPLIQIKMNSGKSKLKLHPQKIIQTVNNSITCTLDDTDKDR